MKIRSFALSLCMAAGALLSNSALAGPIVTYTYTGVVDADDADRGWTTFTGQFSFDRALIDQIADPSTADYKMSGSPYDMSVMFDGSAAFSFSQLFDILVTNDLGGTDQFGALAQDSASSDALGLTLIDFTQSVFGSDALPGFALALQGFSSSELKFESSGAMLTGHLTGLTCTAGCVDIENPSQVPEPTSGALALSGLLAGVVSMRRRAAIAKPL